MAASVSVITPSYNQMEFIGRTIESVLSQGAAELEYVVVDGGSRDQTLDVLRRFHGRLRWISEPDRGQAHAVNKGILASSGEILGWLNSDDVYYPGAVSSAVECLVAHPDIDAVYGDAEFIDRDGAPTQPYHTEPWDLKRFAEMCFICQPTVFFRRRLVEQHGLLDERLQYCLDYEFWLRLGLGGATFAYLPRLQAGYRQYPGTKSVGSRRALHEEINTMLREKLGRTPDSWLINYGRAIAGIGGIRPDHSVRFAVEAGVISVVAALRWNGWVSPSHARKVARAVASAVRHRRRLAPAG
jgi:glycosyltransferase involved in cell wall biosynthesis